MSTQRKPLLPIPTTIITGALNTGKTTVLRQLVSGRPPSDSSKWAVLVNEVSLGDCDQRTSVIDNAAQDRWGAMGAPAGAMLCRSPGTLTLRSACLLLCAITAMRDDQHSRSFNAALLALT